MGAIGAAIAEALQRLAPDYSLVEGEVISWRPGSAVVRTKDGKVVVVTNPLGSKAHRAKVLIAMGTKRGAQSTSMPAIVGVLTREVGRAY